MLKKFIPSALGIAALILLPLVSMAQNTGNNAPLGSKQNPIPPSSVTPVPTKNAAKSKGKRGSKTNPIAGSVHPRTSQ